MYTQDLGRFSYPWPALMDLTINTSLPNNSWVKSILAVGGQQHKSPTIRHAIHLGKESWNNCTAEDRRMVTSSLPEDRICLVDKYCGGVSIFLLMLLCSGKQAPELCL